MLSDLKEKKETFFTINNRIFESPSNHISSKGFNQGF